jgi:hypothetical protein
MVISKILAFLSRSGHEATEVSNLIPAWILTIKR